MAQTVHRWLVRHLEHLTQEQLKKFKLHLVDNLPGGSLEGADHRKVADLLVSSHRQQEALKITLNIWEKMGLLELWERAKKEDLGLVPAPVLPDSSGERNKYQEQMREKFQFMKEKNSHPGEHELFHHQYTQLLLLQEYSYKEKKQHELLVQGWECAMVMKKRGQLTDMSAFFDPDAKTGTQPYTVVVQGAAGIGKTTLTINMMLDWAEGKLYQKRFNYVFYLSCRDLNPLGERKMRFADLIASDLPDQEAAMIEIMSQPERLLFIIDGLDELKFPCNEDKYLCKDWKQQKSVSILLSSLLRKTMFPEASLLLTTRLTALGKFSSLLENPCHVEILGFSVEQRKEYFCKFFRNEALGEKAFSLVKDNGTLFTMCSVPLVNWIVCTCLKQQEERGQNLIQVLKTTTALYMCYLSNMITRDDKNFVSQHLKGLCQLAAEGIWERKLLFEEEDLRRHNIKAADVSAFLDMNIFQKDSDCENCYSFIHLSFQEFFAAMFYVMSTDKEGVESPDSSIPDVKKLLDECSRHDVSFVVLVVRFLFGFLNAETARELERNFRCRMSPEIKSQLLQWVEGEAKGKYEKYFSFKTIFPEYYSHLYETQDAEFVTQAPVKIRVIKVNVRYLYEALNAAFCIKHCPGAQRIFFSCYDFNFVLPADVWQDLSSVVNKNQNLKELQLTCIGFADSCMENFCVELSNPNCKLEKLTLKGFKVTYSCCQYLFSAPSLKSLHLRAILFKDDGMKLPCETLGKKNCQLQTLRITHSQKFGVCVLDFFSAFGNCESLKTLDLSCTYLEEGTIKRLCNVLTKQECKLQTLSLARCHLTPACSQNLFSALSSNASLKNLDLSQNSFELGEIKFLCKALENQNCKLEKLSLAWCHLTPACSQNLFSALSSNESLKDLDLSGNSFEEGEIKFLCKALENQNCKLEKLSLRSCNLNPTCSQNLFSALSNNASLKDLDLSENSFEEWEIKLLCKALESQNCKLEKLSLRLAESSKDMKKELETLLKRKRSFQCLCPSTRLFSFLTSINKMSTLIAYFLYGKKMETIPDVDMKKEDYLNFPQEHQSSGSGEVAPQTKSEVTSSLSSFDPLKDEQLDLERCHNKFLGPNGPVKLELINKNRNIYRVHLPMAGFYHWPDTGLGFSVRSEVTVDIEFGTWNQHLDWTQKQSWMITGPLFHIRVDPGVVTSVHLPHFVYLQGGKFDVSLFKIAHFKEEGMVLENPTRVESSHAILENPTFSPMGVLLRIMHSTFKFIPIYSTTLIYCHLRAEDITFHLYLIPSDCTIRKAIDEEEAKFHFLRLHKPSPVTPLYIGSRFLVSGSKHLEIMPAELELCYRSAGECQLFSEIYSSNVKEKISLDLRHPDGTLVWETLVRSGDLQLALACAPGSSAPTGLHFVDQHRDQIISRVTAVDMILDKLYHKFLSNEDYEHIRAEKTNPDKMRRLFSFSTSWDRNCRDYLYEVLKETHPHLMNEIQNTQKASVRKSLGANDIATSP